MTFFRRLKNILVTFGDNQGDLGTLLLQNGIGSDRSTMIDDGEVYFSIIGYFGQDLIDALFDSDGLVFWCGVDFVAPGVSRLLF
jgi:hypothetical protein